VVQTEWVSADCVIENSNRERTVRAKKTSLTLTITRFHYFLRFSLKID